MPVACALAVAAALRAEEVVLPPPTAWSPLALPKVERPTAYAPVDLDGRPAVRAESTCGASALAVSLAGVDLRRTPRLRWEWKIERGLVIPNEQTKAGDDFAARVYVMFRFEPERASLWQRARHAFATRLYGRELPGDAINYLWTSAQPAGTVWDDPYRTGAKRVSRGSGAPTDWRTETVDVVADYRAFTGRETPPLFALGLMTDADNTCQHAVAYFANFRFLGPVDDQ